MEKLLGPILVGLLLGGGFILGGIILIATNWEFRIGDWEEFVTKSNSRPGRIVAGTICLIAGLVVFGIMILGLANQR